MPLRPHAASSRAALALVAAALFLDSLAQSMSFPVLPRLTQELVGGDPAQAARWVGWLEVGWALPQFLAAPVLGALSDRFGRRPIIVLGAFALAAEMALSVLATDVWVLLLGRGLIGAFGASQAAAFAFAADVTAPDDRTRAFAWLNVALWSGIVVGPAFGGLLAEADLRAPFMAAGALALAAGVYGLLFLPESLKADARTPFRVAAASPWSAFGVLFGSGVLAPLSVVLVVSWLTLQGSDNMVVLYTAHRYGWDALTLGGFVTVTAALGLAVQAGVAARLAGRTPDRTLLLAGLALQAVGLAVMGLAPGSAPFAAGYLLTLFGGIARPALQSLMSSAVGPGAQGRLQGAITAVAGLTSIGAPILFTQAYAWSISGGRPIAWSGATILTGAVLTSLALGLILLVGPRREARS
jgi:DHA1 family tetracycline resistance protein-like MFS transporter